MQIANIEKEAEAKRAAERVKANDDRKKEYEQFLADQKALLDSIGDVLPPEMGASGLLPPPDVVADEMNEVVEIAADKFDALIQIQYNWSKKFKETFNNTIDFAGDAFGAIQELAEAFEGQSEASQRRAFKIRKAAAIAQTTIETYKAAQSAYASQIVPGDPSSPIRGAIAATIAVASGLAKVKSIASQQFEGGGGASGGGGSSTPALPQSNPATFNIVGNSGTNQIIEGLNANPVQAYVVAGEVTTAQNLDRNRIKTATF